MVYLYFIIGLFWTEARANDYVLLKPNIPKITLFILVFLHTIGWPISMAYYLKTLKS